MQTLSVNGPLVALRYRRTEKLEFQKKEEILPHAVRKMVIFGDIEDHQKSYRFKTLINLGKLCNIR